MKRTWKSSLGAALLAGCLVGLPACKKRHQNAASDLKAAGYQYTAADWMRASGENDVVVLKKFVSGGFPVDTKDSAGNSALHAAAAGGAENTADYLLKRGLALDLSGAAGRTPLMSAVTGNQPKMVAWLLRQGADPKLKDQDGLMPLMLAVRQDDPRSISELAVYTRDQLNPALQLAAMEGKTKAIEALTNYGASVYTPMEDGRTPLMIAAENGQLESVKLLVDLGGSRFATDSEGRTAADLAAAAGFPEVSEYISRDPAPTELALETDDQVAKAMESFVEAAAIEEPMEVATISTPPPRPTITRVNNPAKPIAGETLSERVKLTPTEQGSFTAPPLVMRHYRERQVPINVRTVQGDTAVLHISGKPGRDVRIRAGETIPGSNLIVIRVKRRMESSKLNLGRPTEVSVVEVKDSASGASREWISGVTSGAHDPAALVEDAASGRRYIAAPGQRFKAADGSEFIVTDVRPTQMIIEEAATGAVRTIPLSGPRG